MHTLKKHVFAYCKVQTLKHAYININVFALGTDSHSQIKKKNSDAGGKKASSCHYLSTTQMQIQHELFQTIRCDQ